MSLRNAAHATGRRFDPTLRMAHRALLVLFLISVSFLEACADSDPRSAIAPGVPNPPDVESVSTIPAREDGRTPRAVRLAIALGRVASADAARPGRVILVAGGADPADVIAISKSRASASLKARMVPLFSWGEPATAPKTIFAQPSTQLPVGRVTLVLLLDRKPPQSFELDVADEDEPIERVWPIDTTHGATPWTWCARDAIPTIETSEARFAPSGIAAKVVLRADSNCMELLPVEPLPDGTHVAPPNLGGISLSTAPVQIGKVTKIDAPSCGADAIALGNVCARVDDDRIVLVGDATPHLAMGRIGPSALVAPLAVADRFVVRGLVPSSTLDASLLLRDAWGDSEVSTTIRTKKARRHVVVNEVLSRPPSSSASQRFVEIVNDGDETASLSGLSFGDGDELYALPEVSLAKGEFALVVPKGFVDGLAGDEAPPPKTRHLVVDALKLTGEITIRESDGRVISRFPGSTSTKTVARGRSTPERPDDAADAFGWDALGRATPGRANRVVP